MNTILEFNGQSGSLEMIQYPKHNRKTNSFILTNCVSFLSLHKARIRNLLYSEYIMQIFTVNVALNKPAYVQYQYKPGDNRYGASNAVDGQKTVQSFSEGQCALSVTRKPTATWWVNLTKIHSIHHIRIYFIKTKDAWGMIIFNCCPLIRYIKLYSLVSFRNIMFFQVKDDFFFEHTISAKTSTFSESEIRVQCTKQYEAKTHYEIIIALNVILCRKDLFHNVNLLCASFCMLLVFSV